MIDRISSLPRLAPAHGAALATCLLGLCLAFAAGATAAPDPPGGAPPRAPMVLPGASASAAEAGSGSSWIVGGRPGAHSNRIARQFGATVIFPSASIFDVPATDARRLAAALRRAGLLSYAEPNSRSTKQSFPSDPLSFNQRWLPQVVPPGMTPPAVGPDSPVLGLLEESIDSSHPEISGSNITGLHSIGPFTDEHGTATAAVAGAADNGLGILGVWPGMPIHLFASNTTCASTVHALYKAIDAGVSVINMSYGFSFGACYSHYLATQYAIGADIVAVAAAGNEFGVGNPLERPANDSHIVTAAALNRKRQVAFFSNRNYGIDLAAPGTNILTAVPLATDFADGNANGYTHLSGTSFSAPMIAAAAAWVRQKRPGLSNDQIVGVLDRGAKDIGRPGYDKKSGFGLVSIKRAINAHAPRRDRGEPNDDIEWVNGRRYVHPDAPLWGPGDSRKRIGATIDAIEDPADVFRVIVPAHGRVTIKLKPSLGNVTLEAWRKHAHSIYGSTRRRIAISHHPGHHIERIKLRNTGSGNQVVYVDAYVAGSSPTLNARYSLTVRAD